MNSECEPFVTRLGPSRRHVTFVTTVIGVGLSMRIDPMKGVGESIYSGFTHTPHHLILDSVSRPLQSL